MMDIIEKFEAEFGNPNKLDFFARKCEICSVGMNFGYLVTDGGSCCSEKCCREFVGDEIFDEAMAEWKYEGDSDILYWTDWEDLADACSGNDGYFNSKGYFIECSDKEIKRLLGKSDYFSDWHKSPAWIYSSSEVRVR
jgi:hypothetical protein